jgi:hypothetical protein
MTRRSVGLAVAAIALACGACGKSKTNSPVHAEGTPHTGAVLDAWKDAKLVPDRFAAVQPPPYAATYCERGDVAGVETLVCEYGDDATLDRGQKQLEEEWLRSGVRTGVALRNKRTLLAAVDRERHDPNGKTINQLIQAFRKL